MEAGFGTQSLACVNGSIGFSEKSILKYESNFVCLAHFSPLTKFQANELADSAELIAFRLKWNGNLLSH